MPFGLGLWELLIAVAVIALLFGPSQVPKVARQFGRGVRELREPVDQLKDELTGTPREDAARAERG